MIFSHLFFSEFAVTTNSKILFYDANWTEITSVTSNKFSGINTIALDERDDTLYFNDNEHGSIFSLRLSDDADDDHHNIQTLVKNKTHSIAFDPLDRNLYWSDLETRQIFSLNVDATNKTMPTSATGQIWKHLADDEHPRCISIDVCGRQIYWTNQEHKTIQRASLYDGNSSDSAVIVNGGMDKPDGIVVDQYTQQIYWVDDLDGAHYSVERAALNGTNRKYNIKNMYKQPVNLAVDSRFVYFTDRTDNSVWKVDKNEDNPKQTSPEKVKDFSPLEPKGIIIRENFVLSQMSNLACRSVVKKIMIANRAAADAATAAAAAAVKQVVVSVPIASSEESSASLANNVVPDMVATTNSMSCLNNGTFNPKKGTCRCPNGYDGSLCEISICHNYCVKGSCYVSTTGYAECQCSDGYEGERCEIFKCTGYCLNDGRCELEGTDPVCHCLASYSGRHCEHNVDEPIVLEHINVSVCRK